MDDIVATRAILISHEAVVWVDTEEFRIAEAKEFRDMRRRGDKVPNLEIDWLKQLQENRDSAMADMLDHRVKLVTLTHIPKKGSYGFTLRRPPIFCM